jgi:ferredoxin-NADP reductase
MAMIRHRLARRSDIPITLLYSVRDPSGVIYRNELDRLGSEGIDVVYTFTRAQPQGWTGYTRRIDADLLREVSPSATAMPLIYVCGPTPFVEAAATLITALGHDTRRIYTERFGATGR